MKAQPYTNMIFLLGWWLINYIWIVITSSLVSSPRTSTPPPTPLATWAVSSTSITTKGYSSATFSTYRSTTLWAFCGASILSLPWGNVCWPVPLPLTTGPTTNPGTFLPVLWVVPSSGRYGAQIAGVPHSRMDVLQASESPKFFGGGATGSEMRLCDVTSRQKNELGNCTHVACFFFGDESFCWSSCMICDVGLLQQRKILSLQCISLAWDEKKLAGRPGSECGRRP